MIVRQVSHVLDLLEYFLQVKKPCNLAEISTAMGWPRSSTFNLLTTLAQRGYLYEPLPRGGYYPSPRWLFLAQGTSGNEGLPEHLRTAVDEIAAASGETVSVVAPAGLNMVFLHVVESAAAIRFSTQIGAQMPLHSTAGGRALLAQYSLRERASVMKKIRFDKLTSKACASGEQVEAEVRRATARGWHENVGGYVAELSGVAVPVTLVERRLAVVVGGPTTRMRGHIPQIAALLKRALRRQITAPRFKRSG